MRIIVVYESKCDRYSIDIYVSHRLVAAMLITESELCELQTQIGLVMLERVQSENGEA